MASVPRAALLVAALGILIGSGACTCSPSSDAPPSASAGLDTKALRNVKAACEQRVAWPHRLHAKCMKCMSLASAPKCGCQADDKAFSGLCAKERAAQVDAKECEPVWKCTYKCKPTECDCFARCYEAEDACHKIASAIDGCLVQVCDPFCGGGSE